VSWSEAYRTYLAGGEDCLASLSYINSSDATERRTE